MATFMYLFRGGDATQAATSPEEMQKHMQKWGAWMQDLTKSGNFKGGEPLQTSGKVIKGTKKVIVDGPYAEAKDVVGGYLLVTANNEAHAIELAKGCPIFENDGTVEVREVRQMNM